MTHDVSRRNIVIGGELMEELLTTKELQAIYKVTRTTINDWRKRGLPFKKYGTIVRFSPTDVERWLEERR